MISSLTQISLEPTAVRFVTSTSHGAQLIRVTMTLREPTILAASVSLRDGSLIHSPLALTEHEIEQFFAAAKRHWKTMSCPNHH